LDNNVIFYCLGGVVDLTKPTLSITNVPAGLTVSNAAFTVMGWAADNVAVASVFYSLNNSAFTLAGTANNWANWSTNLTLTLGTNVIRAYAVDTSGNVSATNSASVNYILPLQVTTTKLPNGTNGAVYRQTLTASGGQTPYSWTNSSGTLPSGLTLAANGLISGTPTTNGTNNFTVKVTDALSATATQALVLQVTLETNPPALTITSPTSNQRWSNAVFTVTGTATDNVAVARVFYSLNSGGWSNAVTGNGWTNWTAAVTLISGTNTIAAYAMDASGNFSTTNRVSFDFVVTNQLGVRAVGLGTISPNFSNAWLEIGRNYSITSTPATGFVFTNWTVSTNWIGGAIVTGTNLQFMMQSNLTLQASFVETNKPTLTITAPTSGQHMTNAMATVTGTASDIWGVNAVWYQLTNGTLAGGTWSQAATTNNYTNWSTTLTLAAGTNMVKAYAVNLGGIYSATNSVSFVSSNSFKLQLTFANTLPLTTNGLIFSLQLSTGLNGHIQVSTNLTSWATLTNFVGTNTTINFRDPAATNSNHRFYRAVIP
jgi:hypothetical protein